MGPLRVGWRIHRDDRWLVPGRDVPTCQWRPHAAPVVHTAVRVPGGDAIARAYAVEDAGAGAVVVEIDNASPEAIAVAFAVEVDGPGAVVVDEAAVRLDGRAVLAFARRPGAIDGGLAVFPVPHRTKVRVAITASEDPARVRAFADVEAVERAWSRMLDHGMRTELPEPLQSQVDAARADLLLAVPSAEAFGALEAWGLDREAVVMWSHLSTRARRSARRARSAGVLGDTRAALLRVTADGIDILPGFRSAWLGESIAAHDVPLRQGVCSFALRWHGARPALLWDVPRGMTVRASALDPAWSTGEPVGETLLAEPPTSLLSMGEASAAAGTKVEAPEQFS